MTVLIAGTGFVAPPTPGGLGSVPVAPRPQLPLQVVWTGWDGSRWVLSGDLSAQVYLAPGFRGWAGPVYKRRTSTSPARPGARYLGSIADVREVFWPISVNVPGGGADWLEVNRAFRRTLHPDRPGRLEIGQPDGTTRSISLRLDSETDPEMTVDPLLLGFQTYGITMVADDPFWQGAPTVEVFADEAPHPPFPSGPADDFVLWLSSGRTLADATISNAGDEDALPLWWLTGAGDGLTSATVGLGGLTITWSVPLAAGRSVMINTDAQTAVMDDGTDVSYRLGPAAFARVPPGESVPLSLQMTGSGRVTCQLTPLFHEAT